MFIDKFIQIGFKEIKRDFVGAGWAVEYKYYPTYLSPNHYTLVLFSHGISRESRINFESGEYRLYIHNKKNEFISSPFQGTYNGKWNINHLDNTFKKVFKSEMRDIIISNMIED